VTSTTATKYQPYFIAYAHAEGFTNPADVQARDTTNDGRFRGHLFMAWIQGQWRVWAAENGVKEIRSNIHGQAFSAWLEARWPAPVA
jgi:hypothetical protein